MSMFCFEDYSSPDRALREEEVVQLSSLACRMNSLINKYINYRVCAAFLRMKLLHRQGFVIKGFMRNMLLDLVIPVTIANYEVFYDM